MSFNSSTTTTTPSIETTTLIFDYVALAISSFLAGISYLPVKKYDTSDGFFFQLLFNLGGWLPTLALHIYQNSPQFYTLPFLGGILGATGTLCIVPTVKLIGLGVGSLIWNTFSLLSGWAIARYGWLGVDKEIPTNVLLNYIGMFFTVLTVFMFFLVNPETLKDSKKTDELITNKNDEEKLPIINKTSILGDRKALLKKILGITLAAYSGLSGAFDTPSILYVISNYPNASHDQTHYLFSNWSGGFLASIIFFALYCVFKKNEPIINGEIILPSILSGKERKSTSLL